MYARSPFVEEKFRMVAEVLESRKALLIRSFQPAIRHLDRGLPLELMLQFLGGKGEHSCDRGWQLLSRLNYLNVSEEVFCFHFAFKDVIADLS